MAEDSKQIPAATKSLEANKPLRVAALGMEKRTYSTLQLFFRGPCNNNYVLVEEKLADITIIDMDGYQALLMFEGHKKHYPNRPAIVVSLSDTQAQDAVYVRKPIELSALSNALIAARDKLTQNDYALTSTEPPIINNIVPLPIKLKDNLIHSKSRASTKAPWPPVRIDASRTSLESLTDTNDVELMPIHFPDFQYNPHNPRQLVKLQYQPQQYLQGYFQQAYKIALEEQCDVRLEGPWRPITILYDTKEMWVEQNFRHLYALAAMPFKRDEVSIKVLDNDLFTLPSNRNIIQSIEPFLWKLALRTSRGRVPKGTNFDLPIRLIRWPNFTRTAVTPHALRIAALWSKQPSSLLKTAQLLNIPLHYVFIFYSAALALNLVTIASDSVTSDTPLNKVTQHKNRNLFQIILNKLRHT